MEQATRESPKTPHSRFPYKKGIYFRTGIRLYYIKDVMEPQQTYLVEDCLSLNCKWVAREALVKMKKEVITPK